VDFLTTGLNDVSDKQVPRKYWLDITYLKAITDAEIAWIESFVAELKSGDIEW
jgi:hypothetical protein